MVVCRQTGMSSLSVTLPTRSQLRKRCSRSAPSTPHRRSARRGRVLPHRHTAAVTTLQFLPYRYPRGRPRTRRSCMALIDFLPPDPSAPLKNGMRMAAVVITPPPRSLAEPFSSPQNVHQFNHLAHYLVGHQWRGALKRGRRGRATQRTDMGRGARRVCRIARYVAPHRIDST